MRNFIKIPGTVRGSGIRLQRDAAFGRVLDYGVNLVLHLWAILDVPLRDFLLEHDLAGGVAPEVDGSVVDALQVFGARGDYAAVQRDAKDIGQAVAVRDAHRLVGCHERLGPAYRGDGVVEILAEQGHLAFVARGGERVDVPLEYVVVHALAELVRVLGLSGPERALAVDHVLRDMPEHIRSDEHRIPIPVLEGFDDFPAGYLFVGDLRFALFGHRAHVSIVFVIQR